MSDDRTQPTTIAPVGEPEAATFWAALDDGRVVVAVCAACGHRWLPPLDTCPRCASRDVGSEVASTKGRLYSWSVIHLAVDPVFASEAPYAVGLVELDDGVRLYGRIVGVAHDDLRDGLAMYLSVGRAGDQPMWFFAGTKGERVDDR